MLPLWCPDNSVTLSGCFRNQCPDVAEICIKDKLLYQIKKSNRQFKDFKKFKKNFINLETDLIISIKNIYLNDLINDKETLNKVLSEIFSKENFSAISRISFFSNGRIINSFINNNYYLKNNLSEKKIIELLES